MAEGKPSGRAAPWAETRAPQAAPRGDALDFDPDVAYCEAILPKVSRTFALSIEALPDGLREPVRVAYLLCRILDTIEDEPRLANGARQALFDAFEVQLVDVRVAPAVFERACARLQGEPGAAADVALCRNAGAALRVFRGLDRGQRARIRDRLLVMSRGMRRYCAELDRDGRLEIEDLRGLERYCYYVAGTVGELLTGLFRPHVAALDPALDAALRERAVPFGLGLQMVNILKDVRADLDRGVCFLPSRLARHHGVPLDRLLDPRLRDRALQVVRDVARRARRHLGRASEYTLLWPPGERATPIRLFCAVPLALAYATLREIEHGPDALGPDGPPKVSRAVVAEVVGRARLAAGTPTELARMLEDYARAR